MRKNKIYKLLLATLLIFTLLPVGTIAGAEEYTSDDVIIDDGFGANGVTLIVDDAYQNEPVIINDNSGTDLQPGTVLDSQKGIKTFVVSEIEFNNLEAPKNGEAPSYVVDVTVLNEDEDKESIDDYTIKWTDKKGKDVIEFENGKTYYVSITVKFDNTFKFDEKYKAFLNEREVYTEFTNKTLRFSYCFSNIGTVTPEHVVKFVYAEYDEVNYLVEEDNVTPVPYIEDEDDLFEGWYTSKDFNKKANLETPITKDATFYAKFKTQHVTQYVAAVPATCENNGTKEYWVCTDCGLMFLDAEAQHEVESSSLVVPALGHNWEDWYVAVSPTCEEYGLYQRNCTRDSSHVEVQEISPLGHNFGEWITVSQATCEQNGEQKRTCINNASHVESRSIPAIGHSWSEWYVQDPAGCDTEGLERRVCYNDPAHAESRVISATGHNWGEWFTQTPATCKTEGVEKRVCQNNKAHEETRAISKTGHAWSNWSTFINATETTDGESRRRCNVCGLYESKPIPKLGHIHHLSFVAEIPATCEKEGSVAYYICSGCARKFYDAAATQEINSVVVPALGHSWGAWQISKAATTTSEGEQFRVCTRNSNHVEKQVLAKLPAPAEPTPTPTPTPTPSASPTPNGEKQSVAVDNIVNQNWSNDKNSTIVITSQVPYTKFKSVSVDDKPIDKTNYIATAATGNKTQLVLTTAYLQLLKNGAHTVTIEGTDEKSSAEITISGNSVTNGMEISNKAVPSPSPTVNPNTVKPTQQKKSSPIAGLMVLLVVLSVIGGVIYYIFKVYIPQKEEEEKKKLAQAEAEKRRQEAKARMRREQKQQEDMERIARDVAKQMEAEKQNAAKNAEDDVPIGTPVSADAIDSVTPDTIVFDKIQAENAVKIAALEKEAREVKQAVENAVEKAEEEPSPEIEAEKPAEYGKHEAGAPDATEETVIEEKPIPEDFSVDEILAEFRKEGREAKNSNKEKKDS